MCENPKLWEPSGAHCRSLGFARDDKGEGSASIDEGDWDGRVRCAASIERSLSIRIAKPNESAKFKLSSRAKPRDLQCAPDGSQSFGFSHTL